MAVAAILLSVAAVQLDEAVAAARLERLSWGYTGGPEARERYSRRSRGR
jgi:hypothetical protein